MLRFRFGAEVAFAHEEELLDRVTIAPLTDPMSTDRPLQAAIFRLAAGGCIRRHPATHPQILAVLEGSGTVSGADGGPEPIASGEAVFWEENEVHETRSASGMTALVLEARELAPRSPA